MTAELATMPCESRFRRSLYLTLGLACVCVAYAEHEIFPEVPYLAGAVLLTLLALYRLESRGAELLTIPQANRVGLVLGIANFIWAGYRLAQEVNQDASGSRGGVQLVLVAVVGPLLITSVPGKLARREKHVGDYWGLHAAGLAAVCLSGALAEDPLCFFLASLYAVSAVGNLLILHQLRAAGRIASLPNRPPPPPVVAVLPVTARSDLGRGLLLFLVGLVIALPLYVLTPRSGAEKLYLGKPRVEIGYAAEQMIDLNRTGDLESNPNPAFEVYAEQEGRPWTGLSPTQRWRGRVLRNYVRGVWHAGDEPLPTIDALPRNRLTWAPPRLGGSMVTFRFSVPAGERGYFLADPLAWADGQPTPVASETPTGLVPWSWVGDGSVFWSDRRSILTEPFRYLQAWSADPARDTSPPFRLIDLDPTTRLRPLLRNPVPAVRTYTDRIVEELIREGRLPADLIDRRTFSPRKEYHELLARELCRHLATTPELSYTTNLRRRRADLDPIEDFLFHSRSGHCERFASALVLMLRSQGIPAVHVLGFKGWEATEEPGLYRVRQSHAHAWVEALIEVYRPGEPGQRPWSCWLSLDPTPTREPVVTRRKDGRVAQLIATADQQFREYFVSFDPARRERLLRAAWSGLTRWETLLGLVLSGILGWLVYFRYTHPRKHPRAVHAPQYAAALAPLLDLLARYGFEPANGETLKEFAEATAVSLRADPRTTATADVPLEWVIAYYELRFGGTEIPPDRRLRLEARLAELARALADRSRGPA